MTTELEVALLNGRLFRELPKTPSGAAQYKWMRTEDLHYLVRDGQGRDYKRVSWADRLGHGWVVARWRPPSYTESNWILQFGTLFPYPSNGIWGPIENCVLRANLEPTENLTNQIIRGIQTQIEKSAEALQHEAQAQADKDLADQKKEARDMIEDAWPAFGNIPGKKYDVSFPTPQTQSNCEQKEI